MLIQNKWTGGEVKCQIPRLPPEYRGASGAMFKAFTFDKQVSNETALILLDDSQFAHTLGALNPFDL